MRINIVKIISSRIDKAQRFIKILRYGKSDVREVLEAMPYGEDSVPIKDLRAIYAATGEKGKQVIIGYINKNQISDPGEKRIFSTDSNGNLAIAFHLRNDGTAELGGSVDNLVRFGPTQTAFNQLRTEFNAHVTIFNAHIHPYVGLPITVSGVTTPTPTPSVPSTADISGAKINNLKST